MDPSRWKPVEFNELTPQFGAVKISTTSPQKIISLTNVSNAPIFLLQIQTTDDFQESDSCPTWLAEWRTCLVSLTFSPNASGPRVGTLYVDGAKVSESGPWNKFAFSQTVPLSGFGLPQSERKNEGAEGKLGPVRTTNDEELAYLLNHTAKPYTFEDLLNRNSHAIANVVIDDKKLFLLTKDTDTKLRIASIVLSLGVKDEVYFQYLRNEAERELAHDHDIPWPFTYRASDGYKESLNPAFVEWCKERRLDFWQIEKALEYPKPDVWYYLGAAGNVRYFHLLIAGLRSQNLVIAANAASGLAKLGDPRAIDQLIAAGKSAHGEVLGAIVQALIYFPEAKAQRAAEELSPPDDKNSLESFRSEIKRKGIRALFQW